MKIRFTQSNPYGCPVNSEYNIHHTEERDGKVYYYFDIGDSHPPFMVNQSDIKGYATIEAGEVKDIWDELYDKYGKGDGNVNETKEDQSSDIPTEPDDSSTGEDADTM